jgi:phosphopantetheine adenylyltransferase
MRIIKLAFILALALSYPLFSDVGYYIGSFDPPTLAHKESIVKAMEEHHLEKVYVTVNHNTIKDYLTSVDERQDMLHILLKDYQDRVIVLREPLEGRVAFAEALFQKYPNQKILGIFGDDTFDKNFELFKGLENFDFIRIARPEFNQEINKIYNLQISSSFISSTKARELIAEKNTEALVDYLDLDLIYFIFQKQFYEDAQSNDKNGFLMRFEAFVNALDAKFPEFAVKDIPFPEYKIRQSYEAQSDKFIRQIVEFKRISLADQFVLRPVAEEMLNLRSRTAPLKSLLKVGLYPGSFDLFSAPQKEVIQKALQQLQLDQLIVIILETSRKPIQHSLEKRVAHAKDLLADFGTQVLVQTAPGLDSLKDFAEAACDTHEPPAVMILGSNVFESNYQQLHSIANLQFAVVPHPDDTEEKVYPENVVILK